jgi:hypothetical protein
MDNLVEINEIDKAAKVENDIQKLEALLEFNEFKNYKFAARPLNLEFSFSIEKTNLDWTRTELEYLYEPIDAVEALFQTASEQNEPEIINLESEQTSAKEKEQEPELESIIPAKSLDLTDNVPKTSKEENIEDWLQDLL